MNKWTLAAQRRRAELDAKLHRLDWLEEFYAATDWGELDSGASIKVGEIVRFGALRYRARTDHTKALTRSPLNLNYWEVIVDAG